MNETLNNWLEELRFGEQQQYKHITVIPITTADSNKLIYKTLNQALESDYITLKELDEEASVPEIQIINKSDEYILIFDGEQLIGAKQNRIINKTILIEPHTKNVIPVSCTEEGRWYEKSDNFSKSKYNGSSEIRKTLKKNKYAQDEVWNHVACLSRKSGIKSESGSLHYVSEEISSSTEKYFDKFKKFDSQIGFILFANGKFLGLDIVGHPDLFDDLYENFLNGYLIEALYIEKAEKKNLILDKTIDSIFENICSSELIEDENYGVEESMKIKNKEFVGEFVYFKSNPLHLAIFDDK